MKDPLERRHGWFHELFDWRDDWRWPSNGSGKKLHRNRVASRTFARVAGTGHKVQVIAADGWSKWDCPFYPSKKLLHPLCIVRVNLIRKQSQYLGWLPPDEFHRIDLVEWGYQHKVRRRVVSDWMLHRGLPDCILGGQSRVKDEQDLRAGSDW